MNDELCNPALVSTTPSTTNPTTASSSATSATATNNATSNGLSNSAVLTNGDSASDGSHHLEMGGVECSGKGALDEARLRYKNFVASLRAVIAAIPYSQKEHASKNKYLKFLIDQLRKLIADIATWQKSLFHLKSG